jgi:hypothetical protein
MAAVEQYNLASPDAPAAPAAAEGKGEEAKQHEK